MISSHLFSTILSITFCLSVAHNNNVFAMEAETNALPAHKSIKTADDKEKLYKQNRRLQTQRTQKAARQETFILKRQLAEDQEIIVLLHRLKKLQKPDPKIDLEVIAFCGIYLRLFNETLQKLRKLEESTKKLAWFTKNQISKLSNYHCSCTTIPCHFQPVREELIRSLTIWFEDSFEENLEEELDSDPISQLIKDFKMSLEDSASQAKPIEKFPTSNMIL